MMWSDLFPILRRHHNPASLIKYYPPHKDTNGKILTVVDFSLPRRNGLIRTGASEAEDIYAQGMVCNAGSLNGEIPMEGWENKETLDQVRGARGLVEEMLKEGCLVPGRELDTTFSIDSSKLAPNYLRFMYVV